MWRRALAGGCIALLSVVAVACSDEDNDGARTDEEIEQLDEGTEDVGNELEQEVEQGDEELDEN